MKCCYDLKPVKFAEEKLYKPIPQQAKPYKCESCEKYFADERLLNDHNQQSQDQKTCLYCRKSLLNGFFLKKHLIFEHDMKGGAFICNLCQSVFQRRKFQETYAR